jgi:hypothetical protein
VITACLVLSGSGIEGEWRLTTARFFVRDRPSVTVRNLPLVTSARTEHTPSTSVACLLSNLLPVLFLPPRAQHPVVCMGLSALAATG